MSTDEKTGIQANERAHPTRSMKPGLVERVEFEYIRHGTQTLMADFEVVTGQVLAPFVGPTRTKEDFASDVEGTMVCDPAPAWIFIVDRLNTHQSESLVRFAANQCGIDAELGVKGTSDIIESMLTRAAFLHDPTALHSLCVYPQTYVLVESSGHLVEHPRAAAVQTGPVSPLLRSSSSAC